MLLSRVYRKFTLLIAVVVTCLMLSPMSAFGQDSGRIISSDGVGAALLGSTPEELAAALGDDYQVSDEVRITVDFNGRVISRGGEVQFRAAMTENDDRLTLFIVSNPDFATAEGVGPTSTIAAAEAIYGDATLQWNPDNESREFVSFENGPDGRILFRTPGIGGTNVGVYGQDQLETDVYDPDGAIAAIWVSCVGTECAANQQPGDEPTPTPSPTPESAVTPTPTPTTAAEATPTPTPEPTPTSAPEATPTPTPTTAPDSGNGSDDGTGTSGSGDQLPRTGATELLFLSVGIVAFGIGGVMVLLERRYLCPAWLRTRR